MPHHPPRPKIDIARLRDIGWSLWDPIGLLEPGQRWDDEDCRRFADEYDDYLIHAASELRRGASDAEVADYLVDIEAEHMALGRFPDGRQRALTVVKALRADDALWTDG